MMMADSRSTGLSEAGIEAAAKSLHAYLGPAEIEMWSEAKDQEDYRDSARAVVTAYLAAAPPVQPPSVRVERWMVDYEHGDDEPQHAVLSWIDDEAKGLPEVGTLLVRASDYEAALAALSAAREGEG